VFEHSSAPYITIFCLIAAISRGAGFAVQINGWCADQCARVFSLNSRLKEAAARLAKRVQDA
jgi:hypothetical protein